MVPAEQHCLVDTDVVILGGGLGTRLRSVIADRPKILADIGGRAILDRQFDWLARFGPRRVVLSLGYKADAVVEHLRAGGSQPFDVVMTIEPAPLGTGGALRFAAGHCSSDPVLALNGDTLINADLCRFLAFHRGQEVAASMLCAAVPDAARYGRVVIADNRATAFKEKDPLATGPAHVNAGVYLFARRAIARLPADGSSSLENDLLHGLAGPELGAYADGVRFLDIGTPESFVKAHAAVKNGGFSGGAE